MTDNPERPPTEPAAVVAAVFEALAIAAAMDGGDTAEAERVRRVGRALADAAQRPADDIGAQPPSPRG